MVRHTQRLLHIRAFLAVYLCQIPITMLLPTTKAQCVAKLQEEGVNVPSEWTLLQIKAHYAEIIETQKQQGNSKMLEELVDLRRSAKKKADLQSQAMWIGAHKGIFTYIKTMKEPPQDTKGYKSKTSSGPSGHSWDSDLSDRDHWEKDEQDKAEIENRMGIPGGKNTKPKESKTEVEIANELLKAQLKEMQATNAELELQVSRVKGRKEM
ncbi:unnamed protein product [Durusdinium trenchii]|uniref:Uncharacterized protein n=1 Tax=Durusdinium trenchii TaxID=1381693 RepID=A0ABP0NUP3_9DINO